MPKTTYSEKLKDPRWQKKRLEILQRDNFICCSCGDDGSTLHVHHIWYEKNKDPWEYENDYLLTLCESCHEFESSEEGRNCSQRLLKALAKNHYLALELNRLSEGFAEIKTQCTPEVTAAIVSWALSNDSIMAFLHDEFSNFMVELAKAKKNG